MYIYIYIIYIYVKRKNSRFSIIPVPELCWLPIVFARFAWVSVTLACDQLAALKSRKKHFMKFWNLLPHHKMGISIIQWEVQLKIGQQKSLPGSRQGPLLSFWCYSWIGGRQCYLPSTNHSINANERKPHNSHNLIQFNLSCVCVPISRDVVNKYAQKDLFCGAGVLWNFHE